MIQICYDCVQMMVCRLLELIMNLTKCLAKINQKSLFYTNKYKWKLKRKCAIYKSIKIQISLVINVQDSTVKATKHYDNKEDPNKWINKSCSNMERLKMIKMLLCGCTVLSHSVMSGAGISINSKWPVI